MNQCEWCWCCCVQTGLEICFPALAVVRSLAEADQRFYVTVCSRAEQSRAGHSLPTQCRQVGGTAHLPPAFNGELIPLRPVIPSNEKMPSSSGSSLVREAHTIPSLQKQYLMLVQQYMFVIWAFWASH